MWYLSPQDVISIGRLFHEGKADFSRIVSLSGSMVSKQDITEWLQVHVYLRF